MFTAVLFSGGSGLVSLASVAYMAFENRDARHTETIQTWACRFATPVPTTFDGQSSKMTNASFGRLCTESVSQPRNLPF
jgi:hypothetical protein